MAYSNKTLKEDLKKQPVPQGYNPDIDDYDVILVKNGAYRFMPYDANGQPLFTAANPGATTLTGSNVVEQKTQANAVAGTVTFSQNIKTLEIYNVDATNQGVFNVNGINITVPATKSFKASFAGTPAATVAVTGSTSYILTRYE